MANYSAIAAVSEAIINLLGNARPPEFDGAQFKLFRIDDFKEQSLKEGISLYLYRLATSSRRNLPPRTDQFGRPYRPPLPLDLYYLLTAWGDDPLKQQYLLGWAVSELNDNPILPAAWINSLLSAPDGGAIFHDDEDVALTFEPLSLQDLANLWEPLKPGLQASACYVARMVALDSRRLVPDSKPVQTREFDFVKGGHR